MEEKEQSEYLKQLQLELDAPLETRKQYFVSEERRLKVQLSFYKTDEYRKPLLEKLDEVLNKRSLFTSDLKQLRASIEERIRH
ncbi:MAG: hypothetical protein HY986_00515 [Candidatus Melainabacteria bacterium]|nr:hypothetical protein [Candidatus Melainabacteria bacterium]